MRLTKYLKTTFVIAYPATRLKDIVKWLVEQDAQEDWQVIVAPQPPEPAEPAPELPAADFIQPIIPEIDIAELDPVYQAIQVGALKDLLIEQKQALFKATIAQASDIFKAALSVDGDTVGIGIVRRLLARSAAGIVVVRQAGQVAGYIADEQRLIQAEGEDLSKVFYQLAGYKRGDKPSHDLPKMDDGEETSPARYANTALVHPGDYGLVDKAANLAVNQAYLLRFDIGLLSPDSVVDNAPENPFPAYLLPPHSETGWWLEVMAVSDDFSDLPSQPLPYYLPHRAAGYTCPCPPGSAHTCQDSERSPYLYLPFACPAAAGSASLRLSIYYEKNLVQSQLLSAQVGSQPATRSGYTAHIDYTLTTALSELGELPPRFANILTNQNQDGSHRLVFNGRGQEAVVINLNAAKVKTAIDASRAILRQVHFTEKKKPFSSKVEKVNLFDENNAKSKADFIADLKAMARQGWTLFNTLFGLQPQLLDKLRSGGLVYPQSIQVARTGENDFVFPWGFIYDIPIETGLALNKLKPCLLLENWDGHTPLPISQAGVCPHQAAHTKNTICPFGFWGFRHTIEQPPSTHNRNLPLTVLSGDHNLDVVFALSDQVEIGLRDQHLGELDARLLSPDTVTCTTRDSLVQALASQTLELVYFYCHGKTAPLPGTAVPTPYLEIGNDEKITPEDITAWEVSDWPAEHWHSTSPLVFINGCHTADLTPEALVNFVDAFALADASGVIGTEITLHQLVANEAALIFFQYFRANNTAAEAIRKMRSAFLDKGNVLGLAYTLYASGDLRLVL